MSTSSSPQPGLAAALRGEGVTRGRRVLLGGLALLLATALWLPCLHLLFRPALGACRSEHGVAPRARALAARHLRLWSDPELRRRELARMRRSNAEWDFMGRTFLVLALANLALREPAERPRHLAVIDQIIEETLRLERDEGPLFFLMPYAREGRFRDQPGRSLFLDGEIALMLGARRLVEERAAYQPLLAERVREIAARMGRGPVRCAESYPDECWTFCNAAALAALRLADALDGSDHSALLRDWVASARRSLLDARTGLLISSFRYDGARKDGPEGSSIWMAAHCLQLVDPGFAKDQYGRARRELGRSLLGLGYAREWPVGGVGPVDIDSGPVIPVLEASPGSSGLAVMAAAAFGDDGFLRELLTSLDFAAFPVEERGARRHAASNQVGDAVVLYALVLGPLWQVALTRGQR